MEPRLNDLRYNDIPGITINIRLPSKSYGKCTGQEPWYNDLPYNDIPGLTMVMLLTERKIFPVITIKSISQTPGNANIVNIVKQNKFSCINNNYKLFLTCFKDIEEYSGCCICNSFDDQLRTQFIT